MSENKKLLPKKPKVILLVDDEKLILSLGQELLKYLGFNALVAAHAAQALEIFRQRPQEIDLVILDFYLPGIDGYQLLHQLQSIAPRIQVIVASGFFGQEEIAKFLQAGVAGMIHKPFRAQQLEDEINRVLAGRPAENL
jgi:two-component system, cell cycle sensor histidine kinase and response regulator CckA